MIDRVFGCECTTKQVYEDAAKEVVLSVVNGVNCEFIPSLLVSVSAILSLKLMNCACLLFSKCFCLWPNKQWKDIHNEWNYRV